MTEQEKYQLMASLDLSKGWSEYYEHWVKAGPSMWKEHILPIFASGAHILEIGSHEGRSACWWACSLSGLGQSSITCVDPWDWGMHKDAHGRFIANTDKAMAASGVKIYSEKIKSLNYLCEVNANLVPTVIYDMVYIDGSHYGDDVLADSVLAWPLLRKGGVMVWDDYNRTAQPDGSPVEHPSVKMAVDAFLEIWEGRFEPLWSAYQIGVRKVR
jgi:predicted O-methyltransferase YrrM